METNVTSPKWGDESLGERLARAISKWGDESLGERLARAILKILSLSQNMAKGPVPFSDIGKQQKDLLTRDYNFNNRFTVSVPSHPRLGLTATGVNKDKTFNGDIGACYKNGNYTVDVKVGTSCKGLTATGVEKDRTFIGDIRTQYKNGNTTVDVKVDTNSKVYMKVKMNEILSSTTVAFSFVVPDHKSGKLDVQYLHNHVAINSSIGLKPATLLEVAATLGDKHLVLGGEIGFDTASGSFTKYNAGIGFTKADFSAAVILTDKGKALKASYIHSVRALKETKIAAEMTYRFSSSRNHFTVGSSHTIDPCTSVKTRFSDNGKVAVLCQRKWRPKSLVIVSAEYDTKAINAFPKLGLALALKP